MKYHSISGRPSLYLNEMITLADRTEIGEQVVRHQFIQALPPTISYYLILHLRKICSYLNLVNLLMSYILMLTLTLLMAVQPSRNFNMNNNKVGLTSILVRQHAHARNGTSGLTKEIAQSYHDLGLHLQHDNIQI